MHVHRLFRVLLSALAVMALLLVAGCASEESLLKDGYYTAEATDFDGEGWKDFITMYVYNGRIVSVEFNAKSASGFIRSWDIGHMRAVNEEIRVFPRKYTRIYSGILLEDQGIDKITPLPGPSRVKSYHTTFMLLAEAAIMQARKGDKSTIRVVLPSERQQFQDGSYFKKAEIITTDASGKNATEQGRKNATQGRADHEEPAQEERKPLSPAPF